jgi:hypothetical protein
MPVSPVGQNLVVEVDVMVDGIVVCRRQPSAFGPSRLHNMAMMFFSNFIVIKPFGVRICRSFVL